MDLSRISAVDGATFGCLVEGPVDHRRAGEVRALVDEHGFALLRGHGVGSNADFRALSERVAGESITYRDASTPRSLADAGVYTATEYPCELDIPLHNEQSYSRLAPRYIAFYCERPADAGGETVLADSATWREQIPAVIRERFEAAGVLYVRNFYDWISPSWQTVFDTDVPAEAVVRCEASGGRCCWRTDALHAEYSGPAVVRHPGSGASLWFNQAHLFHPSSLDTDTRGALEDMYGLAELPRNAMYGDGEPIPDETIRVILEVSEREACAMRLEAGDVLVADNLRIAHGRRGFEGERRIFVTMSTPWPVTHG